MNLLADTTSSFRKPREISRRHAIASGNRSPRMLMRSCFTLVAATVIGSMTCSTVAADPTSRVITSIKPVHSLVSAVMAGVDEPYLMMQGSSSPHTFSMRPSDAVRLKDARVVFLISKSMETSLVNPVNTLASNARVVILSKAKGVVHRSIREGGTFEAHSHEAEQHHMHHEHDEHSDTHETEQDHVHHEHDEHPGEHEATHRDENHVAMEFGTYNMHIWLDPVNAAAMARMIAVVLAEEDPANASVYATNTERLLHRLDELIPVIAGQVAPVRDKPFIVLHDAYVHFENRFGLSAAGSVMVGSEHSPGVQRIKTLRNKVRELGATCVFAEPQFNSRLVEVIVEGTPAQVGILDPLGAALESGPEAYFTLLHNLAASFRECLALPGH